MGMRSSLYDLQILGYPFVTMGKTTGFLSLMRKNAQKNSLSPNYLLKLKGMKEESLVIAE